MISEVNWKKQTKLFFPPLAPVSLETLASFYPSACFYKMIDKKYLKIRAYLVRQRNKSELLKCLFPFSRQLNTKQNTIWSGDSSEINSTKNTLIHSEGKLNIVVTHIIRVSSEQNGDAVGRTSLR